MASITASHGFSDGLKKRSRMLTNETYDMASRIKRCRNSDYGNNPATTTMNDTMTQEEENVLKYTQRQLDYFEQMKQAEIARIRTEYEQYLMKREVEIHNLHQETIRLQTQLQQQERECIRCQSENKLLKRAITIQNQQKEECLQENNVLKHLTTQAAEHIKRLEQTNYALRVHLQTSTSSTEFSSASPDVF